MGSATAGSWIIGIVVYFIFFALIVTSLSNVDSDISSSGTDFLNNTADLSSTYGCTAPRYTFDNTGEQYEAGAYKETSYDCFESAGAFDASTCNAINGCAWTNETCNWFTETFFGCDNTLEICTGELNLTFYNISESEIFADNSTKERGLCYVEALQDNETLCTYMGCTYGLIEKDVDINYKSIIGVIADVATFNANIGLPAGYVYIFSILFFYIPLLILLLAIYFALPIIH